MVDKLCTYQIANNFLHTGPDNLLVTIYLVNVLPAQKNINVHFTQYADLYHGMINCLFDYTQCGIYYAINRIKNTISPKKVSL